MTENRAQLPRPSTLDTIWWCETCGSRGRLTHTADAGFYEVFQRLTDLHRQTDPNCTTGHDRVRVYISEEGDDAAI